MKRIFVVLALFTPWASPTAYAQRGQHAATHTASPGAGVPLNLVAAEVVKTLNTFNGEADSRALPKLSRVVLDFNTTGGQGGGFSFNLLFFNLGANRENTVTNEVTFTYAVPPAPASTGGLNPRTEAPSHDFSQTLLATLQAAAQQVKGTQHIGTAQFSDLTVTLSYGVVWSGTAGGGGAISLVTLDGSVQRRRSDVQTLTLTFANIPGS